MTTGTHPPSRVAWEVTAGYGLPVLPDVCLLAHEGTSRLIEDTALDNLDLLQRLIHKRRLGSHIPNHIGTKLEGALEKLALRDWGCVQGRDCSHPLDYLANDDVFLVQIRVRGWGNCELKLAPSLLDRDDPRNIVLQPVAVLVLRWN